MLIDELNILYKVQTENPPCLTELPGYEEEHCYSIDLNSRQIESPTHLGVLKDHNSLAVYFVVDRFLDYMDLSTTSCLVQYTTPDGLPHIYPIPYYDVYTLVDCQKMIIPWIVDKSTTMTGGEIEYSFRFFKIDEEENFELIYNLNTLPAKTTILPGLNVIIPSPDEDQGSSDGETGESSGEKEYPHPYEILAQQVKENKTYWKVLDTLDI